MLLQVQLTITMFTCEKDVNFPNEGTSSLSLKPITEVIKRSWFFVLYFKVIRRGWGNVFASFWVHDERFFDGFLSVFRVLVGVIGKLVCVERVRIHLFL